MTIALALAGAGRWSLARGDLTNAAIMSAGCWWLMRHRWRLLWSARRLVQLGVVSIQMTALRLLDVMWAQLPIVIASARLSPLRSGSIKGARRWSTSA